MEKVKKFNCIIVDDEPIARKIINNYVEQIPFLENLGEFKNGIEALEELTKNEFIDIVFLDYNMPNLNGLSLAKMINNKNIQIIFTTAYSEYAVESYEVNTVDYLLKPFSFERFAKAVFRAVERINKHGLIIATPTEVIENKIFYIKSEGMNYSISIDEIQYCEAMKNYTKVFLTNAKYLKPLISFSKIENELMQQSENFIRVHRSFLVSKLHIVGLKSSTILIGNNEIPIGLQYKERILKSFGIK